MLDAVTLTLIAAWGAVLGAFFFGGLWWTTVRGLASSSPAAWFLGSLLIRMAVALAGFALVSHCQWARMLACLLGFFFARLVVMRVTRNFGVQGTAMPLESSLKEAGHAP